MLFGLMLPVVLASPASAEDPFEQLCKTGNAKDSAVCKDKELDNGNPIYGPNGIITNLVNLLSVIAGIAAVIILITAGLRMITGGNNPQQVSQARNLAIFAVVGLIIIASAQLIVRFFLSQIK